MNIAAIISIGIACGSIIYSKIMNKCDAINIFDEDPISLQTQDIQDSVKKKKYILTNGLRLVLATTTVSYSPCIHVIFEGGLTNLPHINLLKVERAILTNKLRPILQYDLASKLEFIAKGQVRIIKIRCSKFNIKSVLKLLSSTIESLDCTESDIEQSKLTSSNSIFSISEDKQDSIALLTNGAINENINVTADDIKNLWKIYCDPSRTIASITCNASDTGAILRICTSTLGSITDKHVEQEILFQDLQANTQYGNVVVKHTPDKPTSITVFWKRPNQYYSTYPELQRSENILCFILTQKNKASLSTQLTELGLITDMTGSCTTLNGIAQLSLKIYPTEKGLQQWAEILSHIRLFTQRMLCSSNIADIQMYRNHLSSSSYIFPIDMSSMGISNMFNCSSVVCDFSFFPYYENIPCFFDQRAFWKTIKTFSQTAPDVIIQTDVQMESCNIDWCTHIEEDIDPIQTSNTQYFSPNSTLSKKIKQSYKSSWYSTVLDNCHLSIKSSKQYYPYNTWLIELTTKTNFTNTKQQLTCELLPYIYQYTLNQLKNKASNVNAALEIYTTGQHLCILAKCWEETAQDLVMEGISSTLNPVITQQDLNNAKKQLLADVLDPITGANKQAQSIVRWGYNIYKNLSSNLTNIYIADVINIKQLSTNKPPCKIYFMGSSCTNYVLSFCKQVIAQINPSEQSKNNDPPLAIISTLYLPKKSSILIGLGLSNVHTYIHQKILKRALKDICQPHNIYVQTFRHNKRKYLTLTFDSNIDPSKIENLITKSALKASKLCLSDRTKNELEWSFIGTMSEQNNNTLYILRAISLGIDIAQQQNFQLNPKTITSFINLDQLVYLQNDDS